MAVRIIRGALYTLAAVLGGLYLMLAVRTWGSPEAISTDLLAFIRVTGPFLIGIICSIGVLETVLDSFGQTARPR